MSHECHRADTRLSHFGPPRRRASPRTNPVSLFRRYPQPYETPQIRPPHPGLEPRRWLRMQGLRLLQDHRHRQPFPRHHGGRQLLSFGCSYQGTRRTLQSALRGAGLCRGRQPILRLSPPTAATWSGCSTSQGVIGPGTGRDFIVPVPSPCDGQDRPRKTRIQSCDFFATNPPFDFGVSQSDWQLLGQQNGQRLLEGG